MRPAVRSSTATIVITVTPDMVASLDGRTIHRLYSTFWLAYHAEVAARKAIEPFFDDGENAIGAAIALEHCSMCPIGARVEITATVIEQHKNRIVCSIVAQTQSAVIARGTQTQIVLPAEQITEKIAAAYAAHNLELPNQS